MLRSEYCWSHSVERPVSNNLPATHSAFYDQINFQHYYDSNRYRRAHNTQTLPFYRISIQEKEFTKLLKRKYSPPFIYLYFFMRMTLVVTFTATVLILNYHQIRIIPLSYGISETFRRTICFIFITLV